MRRVNFNEKIVTLPSYKNCVVLLARPIVDDPVVEPLHDDEHPGRDGQLEVVNGCHFLQVLLILSNLH